MFVRAVEGAVFLNDLVFENFGEKPRLGFVGDLLRTQSLKGFVELVDPYRNTIKCGLHPVFGSSDDLTGSFAEALGGGNKISSERLLAYFELLDHRQGCFEQLRVDVLRHRLVFCQLVPNEILGVLELGRRGVEIIEK